jgi:hypothetical protein
LAGQPLNLSRFGKDLSLCSAHHTDGPVEDRNSYKPAEEVMRCHGGNIARRLSPMIRPLYTIIRVNENK